MSFIFDFAVLRKADNGLGAGFRVTPKNPATFGRQYSFYKQSHHEKDDPENSNLKGI